MATKHDVFRAVQDHFTQANRAPTQAELEKAVGTHWTAIKQHLFRLRREGALVWDDGDYTSMRLTSKAPKADKNGGKAVAPPKTRRASKMVETPATAPTPAPAEPPSKDSLIGARAVVYDDAELAQLEAEVVRAEEHAKFLRALLEGVRSQKPLDAKAAMLVEVIAQVQA